MMMPSEIRTIKLTDHWVYDSPEISAISDSKYRRNNDVRQLTELLPVRQRELNTEMQKNLPDMARLAILRRIVSDIQQTLKNVQR